MTTSVKDIIADQQQELNRLAEIGRITSVLLHEISNPLTAALMNLELSGKQTAAIRRARRDMQQMRRYIEAARQQVSKQSRVRIFCAQKQLKQLNRLMMPLAKKDEVSLTIDSSAANHYHLMGDPVKFQQIISNLIVNAIDAYKITGTASKLVEIKLTHETAKLIITVKDEALGISTDAVTKLFDEFYTTKQRADQGLGLGLSIVQKYVSEDFHGSVRVSSCNHGTKFTITLPLEL
ncbi:MAG TPA: HAMP domain-containing sensor histidine kinase [Candidatus Saccharimonadales bacterium]|nr:HAMP domain-containing sensor histidine kinase [Candidatus Saccharimonadales bacterium]